MDSGRESGKRGVPNSDSGSDFRLGFGYIPDWLVVELLVRLPMKCVFRCKCVSKQWRSLISDPTFGCAFVSRIALPSARPKRWTLLYKCIYAAEVPSEHDFFRNLFSSDVGLACLTKSDLSPSAQAHGVEVYNVLDYIIAKDDNGLLLCGFHDGRNLGHYYIFNPVTKQYVEIPTSKRPFVYCFVGFISRVKDSVVTSYKVVRLEDDSGKSNVLKFEIFSSETGEWSDVDIHFDQVPQLVALRKMLLVFNEILHFVDRELGILAYDPYKGSNSCRIIRFPEDIDSECNVRFDGKTRLLDAHQGNLRYFEVSDAPDYSGFKKFSMWTLVDYEAGLWLLEHRIHRNEVSCDISSLRSPYLVPVAFHPFDFDTVYLGYGNRILSYNIQTREMIVLDNRVTLGTVVSWHLAYTFVLPLWPVSIQEAPSEVQ